MSLTRSQFNLSLAKYAAAGAAGKAGAGVMAKLTNFFGGSAAVNRLTTSMQKDHALSVARKALLQKYKDQGIGLGKRWFNSDYWKELRKLKVQHGIDVPGGYWKNVGRNIVQDIRHPIRNIQDSTLKMMYKLDDTAGKLVPKTKKEIAKSVGGAVALPAAFTAMEANTPGLRKRDLAGRGMAYTSIPLTFRRTVPSLAAFDIANKVFSPKTPKMPIMGQGLPHVPS